MEEVCLIAERSLSFFFSSYIAHLACACKPPMAWVMARRQDVPYTGEQLTTKEFAPDFYAPTRPWIHAEVVHSSCL